MVFMFDQQLFVAEGLQHAEVGLLALQYAFDAALAGDVLDLATAERIAFHDMVVVLDVLDFRDHVFPDVQSGVGVGVAKLDLEQETTLEG